MGVDSLHIIGSSGSGGAERFYRRLIRGLLDGGHTATAVVRPRSCLDDELDKEIPRQHVAMRNKFDLLSMWQIRDIIKRQQPAIVQSYMTRATVLTRLKARTSTVHVARLGGYYSIANFAHAHAWIGNTHGICDYLIRGGLPAERVFYIGNFVEQPIAVVHAQKMQLRRQLGIADDAFVFISAGRLVEKKGFAVLLDAFARLTRQQHARPLSLIVLGAGPEQDRLQQLAAQLQIASQVIFTGWQAQPEPFIELADVFISAAHQEPLGNVILEAWAQQKPVIATRSQGALELIDEGVTGMLVPLADSSALAQAMQVTLIDESLRQGMALAGLQTVRKQFSKQRIIDQYIELYALLARSVRPRASAS